VNVLNKFEGEYRGRIVRFSPPGCWLLDDSVLLLLKWKQDMPEDWLELAMVAVKPSCANQRLGVKTIATVCRFADKHKLKIVAEAKLIKLSGYGFTAEEQEIMRASGQTIGVPLDDATKNKQWAAYLAKKWGFMREPDFMLVRLPR
jgi:hypothetical protein